MSKSPKRRLKVFQAQFGFHDTVVAAPGQAQALRIWGTRQNLFAEGLAKPAQDADAIAAALDRSGEVLRRPVGSKAAFAVAPGGLPRAPKAPRDVKGRAKPADRTALTAAEAVLRKLDEGRRREEADLRARRERLEADVAEAKAAYAAARKASRAKVATARAAYRKAGGRD
jgi:hypothetical protein